MAGSTIDEAIETMREAWNTGNVDLLDEVRAPNLLYHIQGYPDMDLAGLKHAVAANLVSSPDFKVWEDERITEGDRVCSRVTCTGTFTAEDPTLPGVPPSGKSQTTWGFAAYRFEGGKVAEIWHAVDMLGWLTQWGIILPMG